MTMEAPPPRRRKGGAAATATAPPPAGPQAPPQGIPPGSVTADAFAANLPQQNGNPFMAPPQQQPQFNPAAAALTVQDVQKHLPSPLPNITSAEVNQALTMPGTSVPTFAPPSAPSAIPAQQLTELNRKLDLQSQTILALGKHIEEANAKLDQVSGALAALVTKLQTPPAQQAPVQAPPPAAMQAPHQPQPTQPPPVDMLQAAVDNILQGVPSNKWWSINDTATSMVSKSMVPSANAAAVATAIMNAKTANLVRQQDETGAWHFLRKE